MSIVQAAKEEMEFTLTLEPTEQSGATIVRNVYECFRMLGDALLAAKGIEADDHLTPLRELMSVKATTTRPINVIDNLRRLRHNINYYGYRPKIAETEDAISIANSCFFALSEAVLKIIGDEK